VATYANRGLNIHEKTYAMLVITIAALPLLLFLGISSMTDAPVLVAMHPSNTGVFSSQFIIAR